MNIKTKFNPGQEVWVMYKNKPLNLFVYSIHIVIALNDDKQEISGITYNCVNGAYGGSFKENQIYNSKEELKNELFK